MLNYETLHCVLRIFKETIFVEENGQFWTQCKLNYSYKIKETLIDICVLFFCWEKYPKQQVNTSCMDTTQKMLSVQGNILIIFGGYMTFFHQGNKLMSNQVFFCVFSVREPSNNYFVISRHHFSLLAYIYMHKYFWPSTSFEQYILKAIKVDNLVSNLCSHIYKTQHLYIKSQYIYLLQVIVA